MQDVKGIGKMLTWRAVAACCDACDPVAPPGLQSWAAAAARRRPCPAAPSPGRSGHSPTWGRLLSVAPPAATDGAGGAGSVGVAAVVAAVVAGAAGNRCRMLAHQGNLAVAAGGGEAAVVGAGPDAAAVGG